jgi:hypothetical protein
VRGAAQPPIGSLFAIEGFWLAVDDDTAFLDDDLSGEGLGAVEFVLLSCLSGCRYHLDVEWILRFVVPMSIG